MGWGAGEVLCPPPFLGTVWGGKQQILNGKGVWEKEMWRGGDFLYREESRVLPSSSPDPQEK